VVSAPSAVKTIQNDWGCPQVQVLQQEGKWTIGGQKNRVHLDPSDLQMAVHTQDHTWSTIPSFLGDLVVENSGARVSLRLADAGKKEISPYRTGFKAGLKIALADFAHNDTKIDLQISLFITLEGKQKEMVCELIAVEKAATILECFWPPAMADSCLDSTVVPFMQGMLLPRD
jgi:hypothetical protein